MDTTMNEDQDSEHNSQDRLRFTDSEETNDSQDVYNFARMVGVEMTATQNEEAPSQGKKLGPIESPRMCTRLRENEEKNMLGKAKERAIANNTFTRGTKNLLTVLSTSNSSLSQIASALGAIDMIYYNLDLVKEHEQARVSLFLQG